MLVEVWIATTLAIGGGEFVQQIDWQAAEGCPSQAAVLEATHGYLGRGLAAFPRAVIAQARVEAAPVGYRMELTIAVDGTSEHHELRAVDCDQLGRDAALLIAGAVDPFAFGPPPPVERQLLLPPVTVQRPRPRSSMAGEANPAPPPTNEPRPASPPDRDPARLADRPEPIEDIADRPEQPVTGTLGVAGTGFAGLFPQVGGGVELEGGLQRGLFRWQLGAAGWFGGRFRAPNSATGADLWAASGSTGFCVAPSWGTVRFAACAVAGAGAITAISVNTRSERALARPWAFAGPDLRVTWSPRPRLGLYLGIAAMPALVRPGWSVSNPDASFRIPPVVGVLRLGAELGKLGGR